MNEVFGVYVHWPYCARICPYCDFNVFRNRGVDDDIWRKALLRDLDHWASKTGDRRLTSIYFGGGTPSLAPPDLIAAVIDHCAKQWRLSDDAEITLEANPNEANHGRLAAFRNAGVNRLSLGVQSLNDEALKFLGRDHDAADALRAIDLALEIFPKASFDLIYARPQQTAAEWERELRQAIDLGVQHLSLYQLTIEAGTAFEKAVSAGRWRPATEDACLDHFEIAQQLTMDAGLPAYEISNHAAPSHQSKHNLTYWRYQDYIGIGPGAHGRVTLGGFKYATETHRRPEIYLKAIDETGDGGVLTEQLSAEQQLIERLSMGLRIAEGVSLPLDDILFQNPRRVQKLNALIDDELLVLDGHTLRPTASGRRVLNSIISELLT